MIFKCLLLLSFVFLVAARRNVDSILPIKGVNVFALDAEVLGSQNLLSELKGVKNLGANFVAVNFMITQNGPNASTVSEGDRTPTKASLKVFVKVAHSLKLGVFLKPLVVCGGNCQMPQINPSNVTAWFISYTAYITKFATLAESLDVEVLSVALELINLSNQYNDKWTNMINQVRKVFSGVLTYCSIFYPVETGQIQFWSQLDFIAMDTYVPLWNTSDGVPSQMDMINQYTQYLEFLENWHQQTNTSEMPVVISETGYPSSLYGLAEPFISPPDVCAQNGIYASNVTAQEMAWTAVLNATSASGTIQGVVVFWLDNASTSDYCVNKTTNNWACGWTVRGKPAEQVIASAWGGIPDPTC